MEQESVLSDEGDSRTLWYFWECGGKDGLIFSGMCGIVENDLASRVSSIGWGARYSGILLKSRICSRYFWPWHLLGYVHVGCMFSTMLNPGRWAVLIMAIGSREKVVLKTVLNIANFVGESAWGPLFSRGELVHLDSCPPGECRFIVERP